MFDKEWFNIGVLNNILERGDSEVGPTMAHRLFLLTTTYKQ